uniref:Auxin-responsive protein n=1 Tax=Oryza punctata TaxID=4537 RepID=A0A0E0L8C2_ORYPU
MFLRCRRARQHSDPVSLPTTPPLGETDMELELGLGLALPSPATATAAGSELDLLSIAPGSCGKRGYEEALGGFKTAASAIRDDDDDDDDDSNGRGGDGDSDGEMGKKRRKLVGWPPVKCLHRRRDGGGYVKVKMEGFAIGRKLDLSILGSYTELLDKLHRMFPSTNQGAEDDEHDLRRRHPYAVTYEDGEGDWMLVGDVPWEAFAKSVKRLKILV